MPAGVTPYLQLPLQDAEEKQQVIPGEVPAFSRGSTCFPLTFPTVPSFVIPQDGASIVRVLPPPGPACPPARRVVALGASPPRACSVVGQLGLGSLLQTVATGTHVCLPAGQDVCVFFFSFKFTTVSWWCELCEMPKIPNYRANVRV